MKALGIGEAEYYVNLIEQLPVGLAFFSGSGPVLEGYNEAFSQTFGLRGAIGQPIGELPAPLKSYAPELERLLTLEEGSRWTDFLKLKDKSYRLSFAVQPTWTGTRTEIVLVTTRISGDSVLVVADEDAYQRYAFLLRSTDYGLISDPVLNDIDDYLRFSNFPVKLILIHHKAFPKSMPLLREIVQPLARKLPILYLLPDGDGPFTGPGESSLNDADVEGKLALTIDLLMNSRD